MTFGLSGQGTPKGGSFRRRDVLCGGLAALATLSGGQALANVITAPERKLWLHNPHTGEALRTVYWAEGSYLPDGVMSVNHLLRDFRTGQILPIDPRLMDLLWTLHRSTGSHVPMEIISGYRSPKTNRMLAQHSRGVARHSLHMKGMAADFRMPDRHMSEVHKLAKSLRAGGVGYYPRSNFVHVDVGPVRYW